MKNADTPEIIPFDPEKHATTSGGLWVAEGMVKTLGILVQNNAIGIGTPLLPTSAGPQLHLTTDQYFAYALKGIENALHLAKLTEGKPVDPQKAKLHQYASIDDAWQKIKPLFERVQPGNAEECKTVFYMGAVQLYWIFVATLAAGNPEKFFEHFISLQAEIEEFNQHQMAKLKREEEQ